MKRQWIKKWVPRVLVGSLVVATFGLIIVDSTNNNPAEISDSGGAQISAEAVNVDNSAQKTSHALVVRHHEAISFEDVSPAALLAGATQVTLDDNANSLPKIETAVIKAGTMVELAVQSDDNVNGLGNEEAHFKIAGTNGLGEEISGTIIGDMTIATS